MPGRNFNSNNTRFGFNGKEKQDELHGNSGDAYDFGARIYDARSGRMLSIDPKTFRFPKYSPYSYAINSPIFCIDVEGEYVNWFNLRSALIAKKALLSTPEGKEIWNRIRKDDVMHTFKVTNKVLVLPNPDGTTIYSPADGVAIHSGNAADSKNEITPQYEVKQNTILISLGSFKLRQKINEAEKERGGEISVEEKNNIIRGELEKNKMGIITTGSTIDNPTQKVEKEMISKIGITTSISTDNKENGIVVPNPAPSESRNEFVNRVATHEGTHGLEDAFLNYYNTTNLKLAGPGFNPRGVEANPYKNESKTIDQQIQSRDK